jgi:exodeoxyribonuclease VII small subunit
VNFEPLNLTYDHYILFSTEKLEERPMPEQEFDLEVEFGGKTENSDDKQPQKPREQSRKKKTVKELDFEKSLERLEHIVAEMEKGELSLDNCMTHFEEGSKLANLCASKLEDTEKKIEILLKKSGSDAAWSPYSTGDR